ncbi:MAG: HmuY family protein [Labilithrix sp.]|nr:HmuY family protein [Labilithrix sp.]
MRALVPVALATSLLFACSDEAGSKPTGDAPAADADGGAEAAAFDTGTELRIDVPESGRVYVKLAPPAVVTPEGDPKTSTNWDVAFEGVDVFTNSGVSGAGKGGGFGPLDAITFIGDTAPSVPFITQDKAGGAFLDWYAYEGASHALWSRYHVHGVRDGSRLWKVQVLTYYGQRDGATVPALYKLRYAELTAGGDPSTRELSDLDGTAGGLGASASAPSECLDLGSGARTMLTPDAARASSEWHLCFRRDSISVNGEIGGPRGVTATDLDADKTASEAIDAVKTKTADGEKATFDAATAASFDGKTFRGDRVVSAFSDKWIEPAKAPLAPVNVTWLVQDAAGTQKFFLGFTSFQSPTSKSPGTVVVRIKPVKG